MLTLTLPKKFLSTLLALHRIAKDKFNLSRILPTTKGITYISPCRESIQFFLDLPMEVEGTPSGEAFPAGVLIEELQKEPSITQLCFHGRSIDLIGMTGQTLNTIKMDPMPVYFPWHLHKWKECLTLPATFIEGMFRKVEPYISQDSTRTNMNWVLLDLSPEGVRVVATNGHILSLYENASPFAKVPTATKMILPFEIKPLFKYLQGEVSILENQDGNENLYQTSDFHLWVKGKSSFPPYLQVIPQVSCPKDMIVVDSIQFQKVLNSLKESGSLSSEPHRVQILMKSNKSHLTFQIHNTAYEVSIPILNQPNGYINTLLSLQYLKTTCHILTPSETVEIYQDRQTHLSLNPIRFDTCFTEEARATSVVMPIRG